MEIIRIKKLPQRAVAFVQYQSNNLPGIGCYIIITKVICVARAVPCSIAVGIAIGCIIVAEIVSRACTVPCGAAVIVRISGIVISKVVC